MLRDMSLKSAETLKPSPFKEVRQIQIQVVSGIKPYAKPLSPKKQLHLMRLLIAEARWLGAPGLPLRHEPVLALQLVLVSISLNPIMIPQTYLIVTFLVTI